MNIAFEYPNILWALSLILIPILLHLFNLQRPKVVYFSSNKFLKKITSETQKTSNLKKLLLLLVRVLIIIALVLSFSKPYLNNQDLPSKSKNSSQLLYIDNSFSMSSLSKDGKCLDYAKTIATSIVENSDKNSKFWIADNDKIYSNKKPTDKSKSIEAISNIGLTPNNINFSDLVEKCKWKTDGNLSEIIAISDCQASTFDLANVSDTTTKITILPIQVVENDNISIDTCWHKSLYHKGLSSDNISIRIKNYGTEDREVPIKLFINDTLKNLSSITAIPGITNHELEYQNPESGSVFIKIEIEDYPIDFDNQYFISYQLADLIPVLQLSSKIENQVIKAMYSSQKNIDYTFKTIQEFSPSDISNFSLIVITNPQMLSQNYSDLLLEYTKQGGSVLLLPETGIDIAENSFLKTFNLQIDSIGTKSISIKNYAQNEPIFLDAIKPRKQDFIDLGIIKEPIYFSTSNGKNQRRILNFNNNAISFGQIKVGNGGLYYSGIILSELNRAFISSPIIAPLLYNIAFFSKKVHYSNTIIGKEATVSFENKQPKIVELINPDNTSFTPEFRIDRFNKNLVILPNENINKQGFYTLSIGQETLPLAFNYSNNESDLHSLSTTVLNEVIDTKANMSIIKTDQDIAFALSNSNDSKHYLWIFAIVFALIFLFIENVLIRMQ